MDLAPAENGTTTRTVLWGTAVLDAIREARRRNQKTYAVHREAWIRANQYYYYDSVTRILKWIIEPGKRVLEVRSSSGYLLNSVSPSCGVRIEITPELVDIARLKYPHLEFICAEPESIELNEVFDYILFSHPFDTVDIAAVLKRLAPLCTPQTRLIVCNYNHLWQPLLQFGSRIGMRTPFVEPNWVSTGDVEGFLELAGFEPLRLHYGLLFPKRIPLLSEFLNRIIAPLPGIRRLAMVNMTVARLAPRPSDPGAFVVSVIVPCRNERDNIEQAVRRVPDMGRHTEIIFCDDRSTDGTAEEVVRMQQAFPERDIRLIDAPGICKAENVWTGFRAARGDVLMILDADLTVMPEELPQFFDALVSGVAEFVNGCRLVYPMQGNAMKLPNLVGNKLFGIIFSFLSDQRVKDTLCGYQGFVAPGLGAPGTEARALGESPTFGATMTCSSEQAGFNCGSVTFPSISRTAFMA